MSREIIRAIPLYVQGKKFAEVTQGSYEIDSGAESMDGAVEGYLGHATGWLHIKVAPKVIVPIRGVSIPIVGYIVSGAVISVGLVIDGIAFMHQAECIVKTLGFQWDFKSGACNGDVLFEGGAPVLTGTG